MIKQINMANPVPVLSQTVSCKHIHLNHAGNVVVTNVDAGNRHNMFCVNASKKSHIFNVTPRAVTAKRYPCKDINILKYVNKTCT